MIETAKDLERLLAGILKPEGFRKKGRTWRLDAPETVAVINLQRSQWSESYYLNLGVLIKELKNIAEPKEYQCQFRERLAELMPDRLRGRDIFDLCNSTIYPDERAREITAAMHDYALPLLRKCRTFDGIRAAIREDPQLGYATFGELRSIIGQPKVKPRWQGQGTDVKREAT